MIPETLKIELQNYISERYQKCQKEVDFICGNDSIARTTMALLWEVQFLRDKVETTEVNKDLVNALETWEEMFLKLGESEIVKDNIKTPDYTDAPYIEACLKVGRKALDNAKEIKNGN